MAPSTAIITLHPQRPLVLLVSLNEVYMNELRSARLALKNAASTVNALAEFKQHPGKYNVVILDFDQILARNIPTFIEALRTFEEAENLSPTPVMLVWRGANLDAGLLADQAGIIWTQAIPPTGPSLLGNQVADLLSTAMTQPAKSH